jgi:hypothetical protein
MPEPVGEVPEPGAPAPEWVEPGPEDAALPVARAIPAAGEVCDRCGDLLATGTGAVLGQERLCQRCYAARLAGGRDLRAESELRGLGILSMVLGGLMLLGVVLVLVFAVILVPLGLMGGGSGSGAAPVFAIVGFFMVVLVVLYGGIGALCIFMGRGLWQLKNWARLTGGILALVGGVFQVFNLIVMVVMGAGLMALDDSPFPQGVFPGFGSGTGFLIAQAVGGLLGIAAYAVTAWFLLSRRAARVTKPEYQALVAMDPYRSRPFSYFVIGFFAWIVLGFMLGILAMVLSV